MSEREQQPAVEAQRDAADTSLSPAPATPALGAEKPKAKDLWDKIQILGGTIAIPIVVLILGQIFSESIRQGESRAKFVELAVEILKTDPKTTATTPGLRDWAIDLINKYSEVPLPQRLSDSLLKNSVPSFPQPSEGEIDGQIFKGDTMAVSHSLYINLVAIIMRSPSPSPVYQAAIRLSTATGARGEVFTASEGEVRTFTNYEIRVTKIESASVWLHLRKVDSPSPHP